MAEMQKPEILYVCRKQFGYSTDNYFHCKYLKDDYQITYISPNVGWNKIKIEGVNPVYVEFRKNRYLNNLRFYFLCLRLIQDNRFQLIILNRSYYFFIYKLFNPRKKFIYDIRSGIVNPSPFKRWFLTLLIKTDLLFYKNITVISSSLGNQLGIKKFHVLPLGADKFKIPNKSFHEISMVYVGTFNTRRIEDTIEGFKLFLEKSNALINIAYHIYGFGNPIAEKKIAETIESKELKERVFFHGKIANTELSNILSKHNVGVSYIPITPYFDVQPPTKTFEYLLAGMPVLATATKENEKVINEQNGVLINDNPVDFMKGLVELCSKIHSFSSEKIQKESEKYSWEDIVKQNFKPYIKSLQS